MRADIKEIDEAVDGSHPMGARDGPLQAELEEQRLLRYLALAHHRAALRQGTESGLHRLTNADFFQ